VIPSQAHNNDLLCLETEWSRAFLTNFTIICYPAFIAFTESANAQCFIINTTWPWINKVRIWTTHSILQNQRIWLDLETCRRH